jgi:hypothetical protein
MVISLEKDLRPWKLSDLDSRTKDLFKSPIENVVITITAPDVQILNGYHPLTTLGLKHKMIRKKRKPTDTNYFSES